MLSFLKPNKANAVGTVLLLAANYGVGFASRLVSQAMRSGTDAAGFAGRQFGGMAGGAPGAYAGNAGTQAAGMGGQFAGAGLLSGAISLVILAALFYVIVSFVSSELWERGEPEKKEKKQA